MYMYGQHPDGIDNVHLCRQCAEINFYMIGHIKSTRDDICVTAAGLRAGNTRSTFMLARVRSNRCMCRVVMATRSIMVMNTISTLMGGHALASPKGGGPCPLGTFNYGVASHLTF